jgi:hypothetical protein
MFLPPTCVLGGSAEWEGYRFSWQTAAGEYAETRPISGVKTEHLPRRQAAVFYTAFLYYSSKIQGKWVNSIRLRKKVTCDGIGNVCKVGNGFLVVRKSGMKSAQKLRFRLRRQMLYPMQTPERLACNWFWGDSAWPDLPDDLPECVI